MADYTIVKENVKTSIVDGKKPVLARYEAGEAVTAGMAIALNDAGLAMGVNIGTVGIEDVKGIALNDAATSQPVDICEDGYVDLGAVGTIGDIIVASATGSGAITASSDLVPTNRVSIVGYMTSNDLLRVDLANTGVTKG